MWRDNCRGWMLAQQWKPQDGGDLMLGLHFSVFPRKRKPASHNARFAVSCAVMLLFSLFLSPFQFLHRFWKNGKEVKASVAFQQKDGSGAGVTQLGHQRKRNPGWKHLVCAFKIPGETATRRTQVVKCGEIVGKQNVVPSRKIDLFMGEDMEVNRSTTITTKQKPSACQSNITQCSDVLIQFFFLFCFLHKSFNTFKRKKAEENEK